MIVVLTRQYEDSINLKRMLCKRDISVIENPCLDIAYVAPQDDETDILEPLNMLDAATFSSRHGVTGFFAWYEGEPEIRTQGRPRLIGAVGPGTAVALAANGWDADIVASPSTGEELAKELLTKLAPGSKSLIVRGNTSRDIIADMFSHAGVATIPLTVYQNREPVIKRLEQNYDCVVLTSPLLAKRFLEVNPEAMERVIIAIGSTTRGYLGSLGARKVITAASADDEALYHAVLNGVGL